MSDETPGGSPVNHGFQVLGGQVQIGNQAIGPGARAVAGSVSTGNPAPAAAGARDLLLLIEQLLDEHREQLPDQTATRGELDRLRQELADPEPQAGVIGRALARLTAFVQPVTPLVVAVGGLTESLRTCSATADGSDPPVPAGAGGSHQAQAQAQASGQ